MTERECRSNSLNQRKPHPLPVPRKRLTIHRISVSRPLYTRRSPPAPIGVSRRLSPASPHPPGPPPRRQGGGSVRREEERRKVRSEDSLGALPPSRLSDEVHAPSA